MDDYDCWVAMSFVALSCALVATLDRFLLQLLFGQGRRSRIRGDGCSVTLISHSRGEATCGIAGEISTDSAYLPAYGTITHLKD